MKKCVPRTSDRILAILTSAVCAAMAFFALREFLYDGQSPVVFLGIGVLMAGLSIYMFWHIIYMGNWGFFYDEEKIIFVLSRNDRREFRWDELQDSQARIFYPTSPAAWYFYFQDKKKTKKIAVDPRMAGYDEFVAMLRKKGFPEQKPGDIRFDEKMVGEIFHDMFGEQFGKDGNRQK